MHKIDGGKLNGADEALRATLTVQSLGARWVYNSARQAWSYTMTARRPRLIGHPAGRLTLITGPSLEHGRTGVL